MIELTEEFYEISKALNNYHKDPNKDNYRITRCIYCNKIIYKTGKFDSASILCKECSDEFYKIHKEGFNSLSSAHEKFLWVIAANSSSFKEFKLKVLLSRLD